MYKDANALALKLKSEEEAFFKKLDGSRRIDESFSEPDDEPLSAEEKNEIDAYWGKYSFAYPNIDYKSFQTFKNRCGFFSVRHCPGAIRTSFFSKHFVNRSYNAPFQNKAMLGLLYPDIKQPKTIVRRMAGMLYDEKYELISRKRAADICMGSLENGRNLIAKPNNSSGGSGIVFLHAFKDSRSTVEQVLGSFAGAYVVQEVMRQSPFMAQFNPTSVNTIRITTLMYKGVIRPLAALVRIGKPGNEVDNWCSGGSLLGINVETGVCNKWILTSDHKHVSMLPTGLDLSQCELSVPQFNAVRELVIKAHSHIPYIKMISWDIALDGNDDPTLIECNFGGMIQIHEAATGPLFGDLMDDLLDEYLLKRFSIQFVEGDYLAEEYSDHVVIAEYIGKDEAKTVDKPSTLRGKPVTSVKKDALKGYSKIKFEGFAIS